VNSGEISPRVSLALVPEFSQDPDRQIVSAVAGIAGILKGRDVPDDLRPKGANFIRQVFGKRAADLGWIGKPDESEDTRLLRQRLVPFVAIQGEEKELIREAAALTQKWLTDHNAIPRDMTGSVLHVAAEFGNRGLFDQLHQAALQEKNHEQRQRLIGALGAFRDPEIAKAAVALLLTKEFDARESFFPLLFGPRAYPETRDLPFQFVQQNIDQLLEVIPREVGEDFAANLPFVGGAFCDASHRAALQAFFEDRVKTYAGGPRNLAQTLEGIDLCIAQRQKLAPELAAFLQQY
jgi:alanyl aminopeptidase